MLPPCLQSGRYASACETAITSRVDLNCLVDFAWPTFLSGVHHSGAAAAAVSCALPSAMSSCWAFSRQFLSHGQCSLARPCTAAPCVLCQSQGKLHAPAPSPSASRSACDCSILAYTKTDVAALAAAGAFVAAVGSDSDIADLIAALQPGSVVAADGLYAGMADILPDAAFQQVCACVPIYVLGYPAVLAGCKTGSGAALRHCCWPGLGQTVSCPSLPCVQLQLRVLAAGQWGCCAVSSGC